MSKKIIVLGGGPGGYVAAIRGAQLGAQVHIVESDKFGGTCLNAGCIPTKALLHSAEIYAQIEKAKELGIEVSGVFVNWSKVMENKDRVVSKLVNGVGGLLKANNVAIHKGTGVLKDKNTIVINGSEVLKGDHIIIATGSHPTCIPFVGHELEGVIDSSGALSLAKIPKSIVIIGGGVIGMEFAGLFSSFGSKVKVVELLPEILPMVDSEIRAEIKKELKIAGVEFYNNAKLTEVIKSDGGLCAKIEQEGEPLDLEGEYILVSIGRSPSTANIGLEEIGIEMERGKIKVDDNFATNVQGIYAIGDCNGKMMLAHAASAQGIAAVEHIMGHEAQYFANTVPSCIYTHPEIASVGITEEEAKKCGIEIKVGRFPLTGNGKTLIENGGKGMVKFVVGKKYGEVLGVHMIGPRATDMIAEAALAIRLEATVSEIISTIHAHPTVSEAFSEAALATEGLAIHWPPEKR